MATLEYTQHTVAWPTLDMPGNATDMVEVSLAAEGGGTEGEFVWRFEHIRPGLRAVRMCVYGDGLACFCDPRVQRVVAHWRAMEEPDTMTPELLCAFLEREGAVPSKYHRRGAG